MAEFIVDTGPLVGWINSRDQWHAWILATMDALAPSLLTCETMFTAAFATSH